MRARSLVRVHDASSVRTSRIPASSSVAGSAAAQPDVDPGEWPTHAPQLRRVPRFPVVLAPRDDGSAELGGAVGVQHRDPVPIREGSSGFRIEGRRTGPEPLDTVEPLRRELAVHDGADDRRRHADATRSVFADERDPVVHVEALHQRDRATAPDGGDEAHEAPDGRQRHRVDGHPPSLGGIAHRDSGSAASSVATVTSCRRGRARGPARRHQRGDAGLPRRTLPRLGRCHRNRRDLAGCFSERHTDDPRCADTLAEPVTVPVAGFGHDRAHR